MRTTDPPVIVEAILNTSVSHLWAYLTRPELMRQWYFEAIHDFIPEPGFSTAFSITNEGRKFTHLWEVINVQVPQQIAYKWSYKEWPGDSLLTMEIEQLANEVLLRITHTVLEDFSADLPEFKRESCLGGWKFFVDRLKETLQNSSEK